MNIQEVLEYIKKIEEYCITYKEWPNANVSCDEIKKWLCSYKLRLWLYESGYTANNFKFDSVKDEKGISIRKKLDILYNKYENNKSIENLKEVKETVDLIEEYCEIYQEWPDFNRKNARLIGGVTGEDLYKWLYDSGYNSGNFKYFDVIDRNGINIKDRLDTLYKKYDQLRVRRNIKIEHMVNNIEEYCYIYEEWPKAFCTDKKTKQGITAAKLYGWLYNSGYSIGNFKYKDLFDKNGYNLKERLDNLYNEYYKIKLNPKLEKVKLIGDYCCKYGTFPKLNDDNDKDNLFKWLRINGYTNNKFRFIDIADLDGISIKEKIDRLYIIFSNNKNINKINQDILSNLNLDNAKDSKLLWLNLYYLIVKLQLSCLNKKTTEFECYKKTLSYTLKCNFIEMDISKIIEVINASQSERLDYYYSEWKIYNKSGNRILSCLFRCLYEYERSFIVERQKKEEKVYKKINEGRKNEKSY